ncbi:endonuclease/exonuclease/phosphatase family protein [Spongiibacter marinus]|uniref:endonuclease/exonuclease/phosphatase family protein n=1 Tax=Spongiibacter marinus TaxID=354246 RepID=UPI000480227B|nr:endonuclease/exonuclease/phosphatase family protein [Spongiibacter marinus]
MKIITWNCNGAFRKKYHALEPMDADVLVIQECEDPAQSTKAYREWAGDYLWLGQSKNKGIGIFAKGSTKIAKLDWSDEGLELFLPCRINDSFNLVGIWTKNPGPRKFRYIGQLWQYLQIHKRKIGSDRIILCGDLNSNAAWDKKHSGCSHSDVVTDLSKLSIESIYHRLTMEDHGLEKTATQYMYRNEQKSYHIDYAYISEALLQDPHIEIGKYENWIDLSDHMPLVVSLKT